MPRKASRRRTGAPSLRQQLSRQHAFDVLYVMRSEGKSLTTAAREAHIDPRTVRKKLGTVLVKTPSGRYHVTRFDRLKRTLRFLTPDGRIAVDVQGSRKASQVARYWSAVDRYLITGSTDPLREFRGQSLRGRGFSFPFVTDPRTLNRLANTGEVSFEDLYAFVT